MMTSGGWWPWGILLAARAARSWVAQVAPAGTAEHRDRLLTWSVRSILIAHDGKNACK